MELVEEWKKKGEVWCEGTSGNQRSRLVCYPYHQVSERKGGRRKGRGRKGGRRKGGRGRVKENRESTRQKRRKRDRKGGGGVQCATNRRG